MLCIEDYQKNPDINFGIGIILVKDLEHRFVAANSVFTDLCGMHIDQLIERSDEDMPWSDDADIYKNHEKDVMTGNIYKVIEPLNGTQNVQLLTDKQCLFDRHGNIAGTVAQAILLNKDIDYSTISGVEKILVNERYDIPFTKMETRVVFWQLKGLKRSAIADKLGISRHAFDFHMKNIKVKCEVSTTQEFLIYGYERKWHYKQPF